jgi:methionine synthase / methylenetetrahydrofolate reductase(NADPH)
MTHPLVDRLSSQVLLADGAMGTLIHDAGIPIGTSFDQLNLTNPDLIASIHRAYLGAGADIIETNTYGANRFKLATYGLEEQVRAINMRAVKLAREAREIVGREVFVVGSVGPTHNIADPLTDAEIALVGPVFEEQIGALLEGGIDAICIETISDLRVMMAAVDAVRKESDLPVIAMLAFLEDGTTTGGNTVADVVHTLLDRGVDVIGANCSVGPNHMLGILESIATEVGNSSRPQTPISTMPNAGWPEHIEGRFIFSSSPEYLGRFADEAASAGARIVGGCCGTTPEHTRQMRIALDQRTSKNGRKYTGVALPSAYEFDTESQESPTELKKKLGKEFVVCVEIDPPKGVNPRKALDGARLLRDAGVTAINVADSPMARVRMSALMVSHLIQQEVGVETIVHFTTRDRSLMAIQSELLGAHAAGVRNILALTGDPPSLGDFPDSSAVYDIDSIGLIKVLRKMNDGTDWSGAPLGRKAMFTIACAVDPTRDDLALEVSRLHQKIEAGADFVMTQPIYDVEVWLRFLELYGDPIPVPIMVGILPLQSARHADFLHNEVPGITLTDQALKRMHDAGPNGRAEGVEMARELVHDLKPHAQGVYLMPSFGRYEVAAEVLAGVVMPAR